MRLRQSDSKLGEVQLPELQVGGGRSLDDASIRHMLEDACRQSAVAAISLPESSQSIRAQFVTLSRRSVSLSLPINAPAQLLQPSMACKVSFGCGGECCVFISTIQQADRAVLPAQSGLLLEVPTRIVAVNARNTFRVPVNSARDLGVCLTTAYGDVLRPRALDIGMTGMLVELYEFEDPQLLIGARLQIALNFDGLTVNLHGTVRRHRYPRYGIAFSDSAARPLNEVPASLRKLVKALERTWLRERVK